MSESPQSEFSHQLQKPPESEFVPPQERLNRQIQRLLLSPGTLTVPTRPVRINGDYTQDELTVACVTNPDEGIIGGEYMLQSLQRSPDRPVASARPSLTSGNVTNKETAVAVVPNPDERISTGNNLPPRERENQLIRLAIRDGKLGQVFSLMYIRRGDGTIDTEAFKFRLPSPDFEEELWQNGGLRHRSDISSPDFPATDDDFNRYADILEGAEIDPDLTAKTANYENINNSTNTSVPKELPEAKIVDAT